MNNLYSLLDNAPKAPTIGIIRRIQVEEKEMYRYFGKQYQDYRKST